MGQPLPKKPANLCADATATINPAFHNAMPRRTKQGNRHARSMTNRDALLATDTHAQAATVRSVHSTTNLVMTTATDPHAQAATVRNVHSTTSLAMTTAIALRAQAATVTAFIQRQASL